MKQDGYTLAETLAALLIIGLALGGLAQAVHVLGRLESRTSGSLSAARSQRAVQLALGHALTMLGAEAIAVHGDDMNFEATNASERLIAMHVRETATGADLQFNSDSAVSIVHLAPPARPRLRYGAQSGRLESWPPSSGAGALRSIAIVDEAGRPPSPIALARISSSSPWACDFDPMIHDCRVSQ